MTDLIFHKLKKEISLVVSASYTPAEDRFSDLRRLLLFIPAKQKSNPLQETRIILLA